MNTGKKTVKVTGQLMRDVGKLAMRGTMTKFSADMTESRKQVMSLFRACIKGVPIILEVNNHHKQGG
jgi:hypothetical protein